MKYLRILALTILLLFLPFAALADGPLSGLKVAIDPGHQATSDYRMDPIGPGMSGKKPKNKAPTAGVVTRRSESVVNLEIGLKLRDRLEALGAEVYMTRTVEKVKLTNMQRAAAVNKYGPDVYLRLHCNGSSSRSRQGIRIYYPNKGQYAKKVASKAQYTNYADRLFSAMVKSTGRKMGGITSSDAYPGTNWAKVLTFLVEMGYMSNPEEDRLLSNPEYQEKLIDGMADFCQSIMDEKNGKLVASVTLSPAKKTLGIGEVLSLTAEALPETAENRALTYKSSAPKIARVDASGNITALKAGTATITAKAADGSGRSASCKVTVKNIKPTKVAFSEKRVTVKVGETLPLSVTITPANASNKAITWKSAKTAIARVNKSGVVTAVKAGKVSITATAKANSKAKAKITVTVVP